MVINIIIVFILLELFFFGNLSLFNLAYIAEWVIISVRTMNGGSRKRTKTVMIVSYAMIMAFQIVLCVLVVFPDHHVILFSKYVRRAFGILVFFLPVAVGRYINMGKYNSFYLPSVSEAFTVSFADAKDGARTIASAVNKVRRTGGKFTMERMNEIAKDIPRHNPLSYINGDSLTEQYFTVARASMDDPNIYIAISRTGSAASELISAFTQKEYNHASLSFDRDLETIISYNGGERVYPPGLNYEMIEFLGKTDDSSIMVYRLPCTREQKQVILDQIEKINSEGSAYNTMGILFKYTHKPNIMFCSQFVYTMLKCAGLNYFDKDGASVKPTDFIELDYYKKIDFAYEIRFDKTE
ncbi:MAG: hypothetical protein LBN35_03550 [Clostridiales Family XIII bacterium]|nr:hypothetical protein [Clostridiales Family XIII bacterium]